MQNYYRAIYRIFYAFFKTKIYCRDLNSVRTYFKHFISIGVISMSNGKLHNQNDYN